MLLFKHQLEAENISVCPNLEKCRMIILPKAESRGRKKKKGRRRNTVYPTKQRQECRNANVLQALIKILDVKIKLRKD